MRPTPWLVAEKYRKSFPPNYISQYGDNFGVFWIPYAPTNVKLRCLVSSAESSKEDLGPEYAWDHISVSLPGRCPNWMEMSFIKEIFFADYETVMQLHVPKTEHINCHPYTLHLWKPHIEKIPLPPSGMV